MTRTARDGDPPTCRECVHFEDDPAAIERRLPGINILGSAWGSTRGDAGICAVLEVLQDPIPAAGCRWFAAREGAHDDG